MRKKKTILLKLFQMWKKHDISPCLTRWKLNFLDKNINFLAPPMCNASVTWASTLKRGCTLTESELCVAADFRPHKCVIFICNNFIGKPYQFATKSSFGPKRSVGYKYGVKICRKSVVFEFLILWHQYVPLASISHEPIIDTKSGALQVSYLYPSNLRKVSDT